MTVNILLQGFGRAMIRPILDQQYARSSQLSAELRLALLWWSDILQLDHRCSSVFLWSSSIFHSSCAQGPAELGTGDISSTDSHVCRRTQYASQACRCPFQAQLRSWHVWFGVLLQWHARDGEVFYCDSPVADHLMANFVEFVCINMSVK